MGPLMVGDACAAIDGSVVRVGDSRQRCFDVGSGQLEARRRRGGTALANHGGAGGRTTATGRRWLKWIVVLPDIYHASSTFRRPVTDLDLDLDPNFPGARTTVGNMSFHEQQSKVCGFRAAGAWVWLIVVSEAQDDGQWQPPGANLGQPIGPVLAHLRRAPLDRVRGHPRQRHNQVHNSFAPTCLQSSP